MSYVEAEKLSEIFQEFINEAERRNNNILIGTIDKIDKEYDEILEFEEVPPELQFDYELDQFHAQNTGTVVGYRHIYNNYEIVLENGERLDCNTLPSATDFNDDKSKIGDKVILASEYEFIEYEKYKSYYKDWLKSKNLSIENDAVNLSEKIIISSVSVDHFSHYFKNIKIGIIENIDTGKGKLDIKLENEEMIQGTIWRGGINHYSINDQVVVNQEKEIVPYDEFEAIPKGKYILRELWEIECEREALKQTVASIHEVLIGENASVREDIFFKLESDNIKEDLYERIKLDLLPRDNDSNKKTRNLYNEHKSEYINENLKNYIDNVYQEFQEIYYKIPEKLDRKISKCFFVKDLEKDLEIEKKEIISSLYLTNDIYREFANDIADKHIEKISKEITWYKEKKYSEHEIRNIYKSDRDYLIDNTQFTEKDLLNNTDSDIYKLAEAYRDLAAHNHPDEFKSPTFNDFDNPQHYKTNNNELEFNYCIDGHGTGCFEFEKPFKQTIAVALDADIIDKKTNGEYSKKVCEKFIEEIEKTDSPYSIETVDTAIGKIISNADKIEKEVTLENNPQYNNPSKTNEPKNLIGRILSKAKKLISVNDLPEQRKPLINEKPMLEQKSIDNKHHSEIDDNNIELFKKNAETLIIDYVGNNIQEAEKPGFIKDIKIYAEGKMRKEAELMQKAQYEANCYSCSSDPLHINDIYVKRHLDNDIKNTYQKCREICNKVNEQMDKNMSDGITAHESGNIMISPEENTLNIRSDVYKELVEQVISKKLEVVKSSLNNNKDKVEHQINKNSFISNKSEECASLISKNKSVKIQDDFGFDF